MPVPNTNTFSLTDVTTEIAGTQTSLSACFSAAKAAGFDPLYEGSKDRLSNFRNYDDNPALTYYSLTGCAGAAAAYTLIVPTLTNNRFILPGGTPIYYYANGSTTTVTSPPAGYNGSIQQVSGQTFCP